MATISSNLPTGRVSPKVGTPTLATTGSLREQLPADQSFLGENLQGQAFLNRSVCNVLKASSSPPPSPKQKSGEPGEAGVAATVIALTVGPALALLAVGAMVGIGAMGVEQLAHSAQGLLPADSLGKGAAAVTGWLFAH